MAICKSSEPRLNKLRERYRKARRNNADESWMNLSPPPAIIANMRLPCCGQAPPPESQDSEPSHCADASISPEDKRAILWLAELFDQIGSKRLRVAMDVELDHLRQHHLQVSRACFQRLKIHQSLDDGSLRRTERRARRDIAAERSRALYSNPRSRFAPLPTGTISVRALRKSTWCNMMAVIPVVFCMHVRCDRCLYGLDRDAGGARTKPRTMSLPPWNTSVRICRFRSWDLTRTMAVNSSTMSWCAIATMNSSLSPAGA